MVINPSHNSLRRSRIIGCGGYLPKNILTNDELAKLFNLETDDEWIKSRTGISQRHIAGEDEYTSHLALKAAQNAILDSGISANKIELIVVCTTTPDNSFPSTASKLQGYLGLDNVPSFDLQAVCSGFIYGLHVIDGLIRSGLYNTVLLVCAEKMSSLLDWTDRKTCVLFGDGAGAVILSNDSTAGIIDSKIYSNGSYCDTLFTDGGISLNGTIGKIRMKGPELFRSATECMTHSVQKLLAHNNMSIDDIDYFIPHQANVRIIDSIAQRLNFDDTKIIKTIAKHANCSAASIPLALSDFKSSGQLQKGKNILFCSFGAGLTWGCAITNW